MYYVSGHFIPFFLSLENIEFGDDFQQYMMGNLIIKELKYFLQFQYVFVINISC